MTNYNPNLVKINRSYTYEELAAVFGVHKNTVAAWVRNGLPCLKDMRPYLILGASAKLYLQEQRTSNKQKCKQNELYCMCCKKPTTPYGNLVDYLPSSQTKGRLSGLCFACHNVINKFIGYSQLQEYSRIFDITKPMGLEHINDSDNPLLNSDLKSELKP